MQILEAKAQKIVPTKVSCYHCGEDCQDEKIHIEEKNFCCTGCKTVYEILNQNDLCQYYELDEQAGISLKGQKRAAFAFLDDEKVRDRLLSFRNESISKVSFYLPQIHCASCIWLLENLYKLNDGVNASSINFLKKEITITYKNELTTLRSIVELLASIGYNPSINLSDLDETEKPSVERKLYYKIGVAGFAFGNIMLLSFPEYMGLDKTIDQFFFQFFGYLNIFLALPVLFFSGFDYLRSAWVGLKNGTLNIDVPISIGMLTLFGRSAFEIVTHTGAGYLDSLAGLVFFLLLGKWFQQRTYHHISFERDYKSYFPISAHLKKAGQLTTVALDQLKPGHIIVVKNQELIPADGLLLKGEAQVDYSFVTGESDPVQCKEGQKLYAGGRQIGASIEIELTRKVAQSYLTQLWNDKAFTKKQESATVELADRVGKIFTTIILLVALITLVYWIPRDITTAINAFSAVLIIACPCAVALAIPFIFGNALRLMGQQQFFLKNTSIIEKLIRTDFTVFDKTGTITQRKGGKVIFEGVPLSQQEWHKVFQLTQNSNHPVSQKINQYSKAFLQDTSTLLDMFKWEEVIGKGVQAQFEDQFIKLGSALFIGLEQEETDKGVYLQINGAIRGYFRLENKLRTGFEQVLAFFKTRGPVYLLSGDFNHTRQQLAPLFGNTSQLRYRQSPKDKLTFIRNHQEEGNTIMMLGDGLNDAGALQQSDLGIVVAENTNNFTPACDAILDAQQFAHLPQFIAFAQKSVRLVYMAYGFAVLYNIIGLSFAVQGTLSPIVAAILMPLSSISIVLFGMLGSNWIWSQMKKQMHQS